MSYKERNLDKTIALMLDTLDPRHLWIDFHNGVLINFKNQHIFVCAHTWYVINFTAYKRCVAHT